MAVHGHSLYKKPTDGVVVVGEEVLFKDFVFFMSDEEGALSEFPFGEP